MDAVVLSKGKKLLLMGSKAFAGQELPNEIKRLIDAAINQEMAFIVGEAKGACRLFQDYLHNKGYHDVIVGHARSLRYNAGNWPNIKYGDDLRERERNMVNACDSAIAIWVNKSGVIAGNLERLKWLRKPTFIYECSSYSNKTTLGPLDPNRIFEPYLYQKLKTSKR